MILRNVLIALIAMIGFSFCKSSKKTTTEKAAKQETMVNTNSEALATDNYRFIVSFFSTGGGPDMRNVKAFKDFVAAYSNKINKTIIPDIFSWGREGESDYCYKLNGLTEKEQKEFIAESNKIFASSKLVHVSENEACRHKRK